MSELSEITGIDRGTIKNRLLDTEFEKKGSARMYDTREALPVIYGKLSSGGERLDPSQEKAKLDKARRAELEQKMQVASGQLIDANEAAGEYARLVSAAKATLLGCGTRAGSQIAREFGGPEREIQRIIDQDISETLEVLSKTDQNDQE